MRTRTLLAAVGTSAAIIALTACPGFEQADCVSLNTCDCTFDDAGICHLDDGGPLVDGVSPPGNDGSVDGASDGSPTDSGLDTGPSCDLSADPKDAPVCVDDAYGVFVDATNGSDSGDGTKAQPFKTITKAITVGSKSRVYICSGTYTDALTISAQNNVSLYGGFSCAGWGYTGTKASIAPTSNTGITVSSAANVQMEDLQVNVNAGTQPGSSAIAIFVNGGTVTLTRVAAVAGNGVVGSAGADGSTVPNYVGTTAKQGMNANAAVAGGEDDCTCTDNSTSTGGKGATATSPFPDQGFASPATGSPNAGTSGPTACTAGGTGGNGASGTLGAGSTSAGSLSATGWVAAAAGSSGGNGTPGQGGGGGGAEATPNFAGGGGACGGCGGKGGAPEQMAARATHCCPSTQR